METFLNICGDYGRTSRPETIGMKINSSGSAPSEDVARLAGARFVNISEPDKKLVLNAALLKSLTGNDTINARFLHENSFDFRPQFKIFINTNHLPMVTDLTLITSGRVKIIPFERHFEEWEQDKNLKNLFSEEENLSGILNWIIEGYRKIQTDGFKVPATVRQATLDYHKENDKIGLFVEERLTKDANAEERTSALYFAYQNWCKDNGLKNTVFYIDDGFSGTTFDRPDFNRMINDIEAGKVETVVIKDMSRFGRDYLKVGYYTEIIFPEADVRFIAINNGIDSANQEDSDFTPFLNIISEWYAKDTSKKIKAVFKAKGEAGKPLATNPPYGYLKSSEDKNKWIVDEEAAEVIKEIFKLCMSGFGPTQIARKLEEKCINVPSVHIRKMGFNHPARPPKKSLCLEC